MKQGSGVLEILPPTASIPCRMDSPSLGARMMTHATNTAQQRRYGPHMRSVDMPHGPSRASMASSKKTGSTRRIATPRPCVKSVKIGHVVAEICSQADKHTHRSIPIPTFTSACSECFYSTLVIPTTRRTTLGDRAFSVTAARAWNAVPSSVRSAPSLLQFRRDLKTALFQSSYSSP